MNCTFNGQSTRVVEGARPTLTYLDHRLSINQFDMVCQYSYLGRYLPYLGKVLPTRATCLLAGLPVNLSA
jgi:hypothetical protein